MKAKYDDLAKARQKALELGGVFLWKDSQIDTYFCTKKGKLKLRQSELNGAELLPYLKVAEGDLKRSDYVRLPTDQPALLASLLGHLLGTKLQVRKIREVYLLENVRVHLDQVEGLGNFLEFEAVYSDDTDAAQARESRRVAELMVRFGVGTDSVIAGSYPELMEDSSLIRRHKAEL